MNADELSRERGKMILRKIIRRLFGYKPGSNMNSIVYGPPSDLYEDEESSCDKEFNPAQNIGPIVYGPPIRRRSNHPVRRPGNHSYMDEKDYSEDDNDTENTGRTNGKRRV